MGGNFALGHLEEGIQLHKPSCRSLKKPFDFLNLDTHAGI